MEGLYVKFVDYTAFPKIGPSYKFDENGDPFVASDYDSLKWSEDFSFASCKVFCGLSSTKRCDNIMMLLLS